MLVASANSGADQNDLALVAGDYVTRAVVELAVASRAG